MNSVEVGTEPVIWTEPVILSGAAAILPLLAMTSAAMFTLKAMKAMKAAQAITLHLHKLQNCTSRSASSNTTKLPPAKSLSHVHRKSGRFCRCSTLGSIKAHLSQKQSWQQTLFPFVTIKRMCFGLLSTCSNEPTEKQRYASTVQNCSLK